MDRSVLETGADRYVIVSHIAEGGMGAIFLGKKIGIGGFEKEVVLKQLLPEFTSQSEFIDLFLREARLSAALDHANIVHTIDLVSSGSNYFIVMEYVDGGDLRTIARRVKRRGHRLAPAAALFIAREVLSALAYAHEKKDNEGRALKLIHRDISPSNVMVSSAGQVKLTDFGIAKAATHKSIFYRVKGKVGYMSPEQAWGRPLDHRSDLYSLAVVLYELLAGERLFVADLMSVPEQIYSQPVPPLEGQPDIPCGLDAVVARSLALDADDRYQTAPELLDALVKVALDNGILFNSMDLASHLREVCGDDPGQWNQEQIDDGDQPAGGPGTMVLEGEDHNYSGVELTSMIASGDADPAILDRPAPGTEAIAPGDLAEHDLAETTAAPRPAPADDVRGAFESGASATFEVRREQPSARSGQPQGSGRRDGAEWGDDETDDDFWAGQETIALPRKQGAIDRPAREQHRPPPPAGSHEPAVVVDPLAEHEVHEPEPYQAPPPQQPPAPTSAPRASGAPVPGRRQQLPEPRLAAEPRRAPEAPRPFKLAPTSHRPLTPLNSTANLPAPAGEERSRLALWVAAGLLLSAAGAIVIFIGLYEGGGGSAAADAAVPPADVGTDSAPDAGPRPADRGVVARKPDAAPRPPDAAGTPPDATAGVQLTVESSPTKAFVYLDAVRQCRTTCTVRDLDPGHLYVLSVRKRNYVSWSQLVDPRGRTRIVTKAYLSEEPDSRKVGYLRIRSLTPADVSVDGAKVGHVTGQGRIPLAAGRHEITLSHPRRRKRLRFLVTIYRQRLTTTERMKF